MSHCHQQLRHGRTVAGEQRATELISAFIVRFVRFVIFAIFAMFAGQSVSARGPADSCALALVLAIDVSGSVDAGEYQLQAGGLADALRSEDVAAALAAVRGGVFMSAVHWSGNGQQAQVTPWTLLRERTDADRLASLIEGQPRRFDKYSTAIGEALMFADAQFAKLPRTCRRNVIDISGDGRSNEGWSPNLVRDRLVQRGVTVNALAILASDPDLLTYFQRYIIGGAGSFAMSADRFEDYPTAIRRKLVREILPPIATPHQRRHGHFAASSPVIYHPYHPYRNRPE